MAAAEQLFVQGEEKKLPMLWIYGYPHLSLHKSDEGLNKLDEWLLTLMTRLGARRRWFGLGRGEDGTGRRWWRAPPEMAGEAWEKSALKKKRNQMHHAKTWSKHVSFIIQGCCYFMSDRWGERRHPVLILYKVQFNASFMITHSQ